MTPDELLAELAAIRAELAELRAQVAGLREAFLALANEAAAVRAARLAALQAAINQQPGDS